MAEQPAAPADHPLEQSLTLDMGRIKCLGEHIKEALAEWAESHEGTCAAEIGHAFLYVMYAAGKETGLNTKVLAVLRPEPPPAQPLTKAAKAGGFDA